MYSRAIGTAAALLLPFHLSVAFANEEHNFPLRDLSISDLMKMEVTSVSRKPEIVANAAAALTVISHDDIVRSGATNLADALRYVPGIEVAQSGAHTWEVTARGFNGGFADKLLVLIDGRSIYTPIFSGVFWEQATMLEDVERIEVIRGPGAAMWGANAVNGVINVITKKARDTRGDYVAVGVGNTVRDSVEFRHGDSFADGDGSYRVYGQSFNRSASLSPAGKSQDDAWVSSQVGFRVDRDLNYGDRLTVHGDLYDMTNGTPLTSHAVLVPPYSSYQANNAATHGGNLLVRWDKAQGSGTETSVQAYYDQTQFDALFSGANTQTFDLDFQQRVHPHGSHDVIWGANYRHIQNDATSTSQIAFNPSAMAYHNASLFLQDEITVVPERLHLILGAKEEYSYFGGWQFQPSVKALWTPSETNTLWVSAANASRTPSLIESQSASIAVAVRPPLQSPFNPFNPLTYPTQVLVNGSKALSAETVTAYEAGLRTQWSEALSTDLAVYSNTYQNIIQWAPVNPYPYVAAAPVAQPVPHLVIPLTYSNAPSTTWVQGIEASANWFVTPGARAQVGYTYTKISAPPWDGFNYNYAELTPMTQAFVRYQVDTGGNSKLGVSVRFVGELTATGYAVPAHTTADVNYDCIIEKGVRLAVSAQGLLQSQHAEFIVPGQPASEIPRSIYAKLIWSR